MNSLIFILWWTLSLIHFVMNSLIDSFCDELCFKALGFRYDVDSKQSHWLSVKILHCFLHADPNIKVTEPTVKVLAPSAKECEDRNKKKKKTLVCVATRFYPDHVTVFWQVNNVNRTEGAGTDNRALWDKDGLYSITSRLRVPANEWHKPENRFTCIVSFYDGTDNIRVNDTISGDLQGNKTMNIVCVSEKKEIWLN